MLFEDRSDGRYYLGTRSPSARGASRKVFGDGHLYAKYGGKGFLYSPLAFSQINGSLVDEVLASAGRLLRLTPEAAFFDLYCGYGLFTLALGPSARSAVGIERSPESIEAAIANGARLRAGNVRFVRCEITEESLGAVIAHARPGDAVLLDPARGGTAPGVIECVAARRPGRVVHLFCNIDLICAEIGRWAKSGYRVAEAVPFDMFPGTDDVEVMVLLLPS